MTTRAEINFNQTSVQSYPRFSGGGHVFIIPRYVRCSITLSPTNFSLVFSHSLFLSVYPFQTPLSPSSSGCSTFCKSSDISTAAPLSRCWTSPQSTRTLISLWQVSWVKNSAVVTTPWGQRGHTRSSYLQFLSVESCLPLSCRRLNS